MRDLQSPVWRLVDLGHEHLRWKDCFIRHRDINPTSPAPVSREVKTEGLVSLTELEFFDEISKQKQTLSYQGSRFPEWQQIKQLSTSPYLSFFEHISRRSGSLCVAHDEGEIKPRALLSRWLSDQLIPAAVIGEDQREIELEGVVWLSSPAMSPHFSAHLYQTLADLPVTRGGPLNSAIAHLMGALPAQKLNSSLGVWGILDVGVGTASWDLLEFSQTREMFSIKSLSSYGQDWVGELGLQRAILNTQLNEHQMAWSDLGLDQRARTLTQTRSMARFVLKRAWPKYLNAPSFGSYDQPFSGHLNEVCSLYTHGTNRAVLAWIEHSLSQNRIGLEALRGIWVTGIQGVAMIKQLRRALPSVNLRVAPRQAGLKGARNIAQSLYSVDGVMFHVEDVTSRALILQDDYENLTRQLWAEQTPLPIVIDTQIGATTGEVSLWLSTYGDDRIMIAKHPPISTHSHLRIYYEGPQLFELIWVIDGIERPDQSTQWQLLGSC